MDSLRICLACAALVAAPQQASIPQESALQSAPAAQAEAQAAAQAGAQAATQPAALESAQNPAAESAPAPASPAAPGAGEPNASERAAPALETPAAAARARASDPLESALELLAALVRRTDGDLVTIGVSAGGHPVALLRLGPAGGAPAVLVGQCAGTSSRGFELLSGLVAQRAAAALGGAAAARTLYVGIDLAPDAGAAGDHADYARNFPAGWLPAGFDRAEPEARPGAFPLELPEAEALARFLSDHEEIACVALLDARAAQAADCAGRAAAARVALSTPHWAALPSECLPDEPGEPLRFVRESLGRAALALQPLGAARASGEREDPELGQLVAQLLEALPVLQPKAGVRERLATDTWVVGVELALAGAGPAAITDWLPGLGGTRLDWSGSALDAAVLRTQAQPVGRWLPIQSGGVWLGELRPEDAARVELYVRGAPGAALQGVVRSARAGEARLEIALPPESTAAR